MIFEIDFDWANSIFKFTCLVIFFPSGSNAVSIIEKRLKKFEEICNRYPPTSEHAVEHRSARTASSN